MSEDNDSLIGFDPLAWMREDGGQGEPAPPATGSDEQPGSDAAAAPNSGGADAEPSGGPAVVEAAAAAATAEPKPVEAGVDDPRIVLPASCDISLVSGLHEQMMRHTRKGDDVTIDASEVERIDAATLQLLVAWSQACRSAGHPIQWQGAPSAPLIEAAHLLDLARHLDLAA